MCFPLHSANITKKRKKCAAAASNNSIRRNKKKIRGIQNSGRTNQQDTHTQGRTERDVAVCIYFFPLSVLSLLSFDGIRIQVLNTHKTQQPVSLSLYRHPIKRQRSKDILTRKTAKSFSSVIFSSLSCECTRHRGEKRGHQHRQSNTAARVKKMAINLWNEMKNRIFFCLCVYYDGIVYHRPVNAQISRPRNKSR